MQRANVNARSDDAASEYKQSFAEVISPPPSPGSKEFNKANPMLSDTLSQTLSALCKVQASSQDNLVAVAGNTMPPADMYVPPVITPPGQKARIGATVKSTPVVLTKIKLKLRWKLMNKHHQ